MSDQKHRLVTRSDFDGLVCAVLLKQLDLIDDIKFVHPKDMQDGAIEITPNDIVTNLPYVENAHLVFDHHLSEVIRNQGERANHIIDPDAPSAARVVWAMTCLARLSAGTASSHGIWLASSKITTSNSDVDRGRVSETDSGLINQIGLRSLTTKPLSPLASSRMAR